MKTKEPKKTTYHPVVIDLVIVLNLILAWNFGQKSWEDSTSVFLSGLYVLAMYVILIVYVLSECMALCRALVSKDGIWNKFSVVRLLFMLILCLLLWLWTNYSLDLTAFFDLVSSWFSV